MRSIWKGHVRFSLLSIPICVYSAVDSERKISLNQLHKEDNGRVGYEKKCKACQSVLSAEDIVKGYQYDKDSYVVIGQEDLDKVKLKSTKIIEIEGFVDAGEIHPTLYDTPYHVGPDGIVAAKAYSLLCEALKQTGKMGIGRVVLRDREEVVMLTPESRGLVLYKLRYPKSIRNIDAVPQLEESEVNPKELELAVGLVDSMGVSLDSLDLSDRYNEAIKEMIQGKVEGREVVTAPEEEAEVVDIMTALRQSIEQAKAPKMKKASAPRKAPKKAARTSRKARKPAKKAKKVA